MSSVHIRTRLLDGGDRRYIVRYRRGGRGFPVTHAGSFKTVKEARIRRDLVAEWLAAGRDPAVELRALLNPQQAERMGDLAASWLASRHSISDTTRATYRGYLGRIGDAFDRVDEITSADVARWIGGMVDEGLAAGTIAGYVRTLRMILDGLEANPARHRAVELPRQAKRDPEPPDAADVARLLAALSGRYVVAAVLCEQTGCRVSEAIGVQQRDLEDGRLRFRVDESKGNRSRFVDAPDWLLEALPLRGVERTALGNAMRRACERAKIANVHPHLLRHRRASLWHQAGVPAVELAYRLGHARPSISLDTYAHVRRLHEVEGSVLQVFVEEALHV